MTEVVILSFKSIRLGDFAAHGEREREKNIKNERKTLFVKVTIDIFFRYVRGQNAHSNKKTKKNRNDTIKSFNIILLTEH